MGISNTINCLFFSFLLPGAPRNTPCIDLPHRGREVSLQWKGGGPAAGKLDLLVSKGTQMADLPMDFIGLVQCFKKLSLHFKIM